MILAETKALLQTDRLNISIASDEEMRLLIEKQADEEMNAAYREMLSECTAHPEQRQWYAVWVIRLKSGEAIGEYCFKGLSDGCVEIGYGIMPQYCGKGYTTEAVIVVVKWASAQPGVTRVEAETECDNIASRRVLEKSGFIPTGKDGEKGPRFVWKGFVSKNR